ncbi:MAG: hypothetical protein MUF87_14050 [Anaerolineae bacterium]|nr:hypothetical protein [Anaerolineae bacterium]
MFKRRFLRLLPVIISGLLLMFGDNGIEARQYVATERVSVATPNLQIDRGAQRPVINNTGQIVAFWSDSAILVPGDTNNTGDIFVRDTIADVTTRINIGPGNVQANALTFAEIDIDHGGNLIVYASDAANLLPPAALQDTNNASDVFVYDRSVNATARVSVGNGNTQANGPSFRPVISGNGLLVAFRSNANNLVPGDTNGQPDVFLFDRSVNQIARVSVANDGSQSAIEDTTGGVALNFSGTQVAFDSRAWNLVPGDTNNVSDVFVRDRLKNQTIRLSVNVANGAQGNGASFLPVLSDTGRFVAFESTSSNLITGDTNARTDIFLYDRDTDADNVFDESGSISLIRVSVLPDGTQGNGDSRSPSIDSTGRYISFWSNATNLVAGDTNNAGDIFMYDRVTRLITRVSVSNTLAQGNGASATFHSLSGDGRFVTFESAASNLVTGDTNNVGDVFLAQGGPAAPTNLVGTPTSQTQINLTWQDNSDNENRFTVERSSDNGVNWTELAANLPANTTTYSDTTGAQCTTYQYRVSAQNAVTRSPFATTTATTLGCRPAPFVLLTPENNSVVINPAGLDTITWQASFEAVDYTFNLYQASNPTTPIATSTVSASSICTATVCTFTVAPSVQALLVNGNYTWNVTATNTIGTRDATQAFAFTVNDTLPPREFVLRNPQPNALVRDTDLILTWRANPDAARFDVFLFKISNNLRALGLVTTINDLTPDADADALECTPNVCTYTAPSAVTTVLSSGQYSWTVRAESPAGTPTEASNGPYVFILNTGAINILVNGGFEEDINPADGLPDGWTFSGLTGDRRRCNTATSTVALEGNCAFNFVNAAGENSAVSQTVNFAPYNLVAGDVLTLSAQVRTRNMTSGAQIRLTVTYANTALPQDRVSVTIPTGTQAYTPLPNGSITLDGIPASVRVQILNNATAGQIFMDDVRLTLTSGAPVRNPHPGMPEIPGLIPMPGDPEAARRGQ